MKLKPGRNKLFRDKNGSKEMCHVARREPRVSCINSLKKSTYQKISYFGLIQTVEREREREPSFSLRFQASLFDSRDFISRNSAVRELKLIYTTRATCGYQNHKILPRSKVWVFTKTEKRWCLRKARHFR